MSGRDHSECEQNAQQTHRHAQLSQFHVRPQVHRSERQPLHIDIWSELLWSSEKSMPDILWSTTCFNWPFDSFLKCSKPFLKDGYEFVVIRVRGQSFMLHQIRKMIGMTIAMVRGFAANDSLDLCWTANKVNMLWDLRLCIVYFLVGKWLP